MIFMTASSAPLIPDGSVGELVKAAATREPPGQLDSVNDQDVDLGSGGDSPGD
jgi:hypothetical protein